MRRVLFIESGTRGVLVINGSFCGPLGEEGQAFPTGDDAEIYIQLFPYGKSVAPLTAVLMLSKGQITRLEPEDACYALIWPDGLIQLELCPSDRGGEPAQVTAATTLMRYLNMRLAGDGQARLLLMDPGREPELPAYDAVVPLRFGPSSVSDRFDERAGLVRRLAPNAARIDAALAVTSPSGQGHRLIERIDVLST